MILSSSKGFLNSTDQYLSADTDANDHNDWEDKEVYWRPAGKGRAQELNQ